MDQRKGQDQGRRAFFRTVARASAATAAAAAALSLDVGSAAAVENDQERRKARYRETDHVKAYYRTNRY
jgi:hypothetical protein